nr:hypothetical protein [Candidatus Brachybacter algidus]
MVQTSLFMIEYEQQDSPLQLSTSDRNIQTEHISPQAFDKVAA